MAVYPLVHTQLIPPRLKQRIRRSRLFELGQSVLRHRLITVVAPAGFGKSVWVSSLLDKPGWPPSAWLSLDSHDTLPSILLYHLIHAVRVVSPQFGGESLRTMNSLEDPGRDWMIALTTVLADLEREQQMMLVLDDLHIIEHSPAACSVIACLARQLPDNLHLVMISRNSLTPHLCPEQCHGDLLSIGSAELTFSVAEAGELLALLDVNLTPQEVASIHAVTEGWAIGLRLAGMLLTQPGSDRKQVIATLHRRDGLHVHLSHDLIASLPPDLSTFILDASLLPFLEARLCDTALQRCDSAERLRELHACGILSRMDGTAVTWRLHHLMGEYLAHRALKERPPFFIDAVRHRAAAYLEQLGDIDHALELVVACSDWVQAASLISKYGDSHFLATGRLDALHGWLACLPQSLVAGEQWLLYFQGTSLVHLNPDQALETLSAAADLSGARGDIRCRVRSLLLMIAVYTFANNVRMIRETAARMPLAASLLRDSWSRGAVLVAGLSYAAWSDQLRRGVWLSRLSGNIRLDDESRMARLMFSSIIQYRLGNLDAASQMIEQALAEPYVRENERWTGTAYVIYAAICMLAGDHDKLLLICGKLLHLGHKYNVPHQLGSAHRHQARLLQREGKLAEAQAEFELSRGFFLKANNIFFSYLTELNLVALRIASGENPAGLLDESRYLLKKLQAMPGGQGLDDYALSVAGSIAMEAGEMEAARQLWEQVCSNSNRKGARQILAGTRLLLGYLSLLQGDPNTCDSYLRLGLGAAETTGWENFWTWYPEAIYSMCCRALARGIHPRWALRILRRWFSRRLLQEAGLFLASHCGNERSAIAGILQDHARSTGKVIIHVNCLGGFQAFVNGTAVANSSWKTQKAEKLFKLLLVGGGKCLKEQAIDQLWPESDHHTGDSNMRMALTHIRKALGLDQHGVEEVSQRRGLIYLGPEMEVYTDYKLFAAAAHDGLRYTEAGDPRAGRLLKQAAGLFREGFLPDDINDRWTAGRRTQLHRLQIQVLQRLIEYHRDRGNQAAALEASRQYLKLEPTDERTVRTAMELSWQTGQRQQVEELFQHLASMLAADYGITPAPETLALYERLLSQSRSI